MKTTIKIAGEKYLIRGNFSPAQLKDRYAAFQGKYPSCPLSLVQWAIERGAIYLAVK